MIVVASVVFDDSDLGRGVPPPLDLYRPQFVLPGEAGSTSAIFGGLNSMNNAPLGVLLTLRFRLLNPSALPREVHVGDRFLLMEGHIMAGNGQVKLIE